MKIRLTIVSLLVSVGVFASETSVKNEQGVEIWYDFDAEAKTASVTFKGDVYYSYSDEYFGEVIIPATVAYNEDEYKVTSIGDCAFFDCSGLTSITIPESVTSIGNLAFRNCSGLTSITIPDSVTSIGDCAFYYCIGLTSITIPESVTTIGSEVFAVCRSLTSVTIPESVTSIGSSAFENCSSLTSVTIPESVTSIGNEAFYRCYKLYEVYNKSDLNIVAGSWGNGDVAYYAKNVYTDESGESKLHTIDDYIFYADGDDIDLLAYVGDETELTLPSDYEGKSYKIADYAFYYCRGLTSITIPDSVTSIGKSAFGYCNRLTSVTIGDGVTSIGDYAFYDCGGLTSVTIGDGVMSIGVYAFCNCSGLTSITIPEGVTSIGDYAFYDCGGFTSVTIGKGVTSIGEYAFYNCSGLTSVTIGEGVTSIDDKAFEGCYKLYEVYNKSDLNIVVGGEENGYVAYYAKNVYTDESGESKLYTVDDYIFYVDGDDIDLFAYVGNETELTLPSDYKGRSYKIADRVFYNYSSLTSVTIPESVTSIGDDAFYNCDSLTSITIGDGVTSIGSYAFSYCSGLTSVTIGKSVTSIGDHAFYDCDILRIVTIGEGVTSIDDKAFYYCEKLNKVYNKSDLNIVAGSKENGYVAYYANNVFKDKTGDGKLYTVDDYVFYVNGDIIELFAYVGNEKELILPSDYEGKSYEIADRAFYDCGSLTSVTIPEGVTSIGEYAFYNCSSLTSITIPESVTSIENSAFYDCSGLTSVTIPDSVMSIGESAFESCI